MTNRIQVLQSGTNKTVGGLGNDLFVLPSVNGIMDANQKVTILDPQGSNILELIGGVTIASSKATSNVVLLTLSNGAAITVDGADKFTFELAGNPLNGTPGVMQDFSTFLTSTLGYASVPASVSTVGSVSTPVTINADGSISGSVSNNVVSLPIGQSAVNSVVTANTHPDVFSFNVAAAKASTTATQDVLKGFSPTTDSLSLSGVSNITPGQYTLANLPAGSGIQAAYNGINGDVLIQLGFDSNKAVASEVITLDVTGVTDSNLADYNVTIASSSTSNTTTTQNNIIALPVAQSAASSTVAATTHPSVFGLDLGAAKAATAKTQDVITGFSASTDALSLANTHLTPGQYTLATLPTSIQSVGNAINGDVLINLGVDANNSGAGPDLITLDLTGVSNTNTSLYNVTIIS